MHAAQAFLFEKHGRVFKKHATVQGEFGRLVKDNTDFDLELRAFLGRSYQLKAIADYEAGPGIGVSDARAAEAITVARRFLQTIESLIRP